VRQAKVYGIRPDRTFREAATRYLKENLHKSSIGDDALHIRQLDSFIGSLTLNQIHSGSLQPFVKARQKLGRKNKTINLALGVVRRILNLAASEWIDDHGLTFLNHAPKIKLLATQDSRKPYPLSLEEQQRLFEQLPEHLRQMCLFKANTGCREQEVCQLRWEWEVAVPNLGTSVFIIPATIIRNERRCSLVKNGEDRLVILNQVAKAIIDARRGIDNQYVFTYLGHPIQRINNSAWRRAKAAANIPQVRVHDLKHTFGRRLRAAGVSFEDRQDLLGHKSGRITTHYSAAEIDKLLEAANKVCHQEQDSSTFFVLKQKLNRETFRVIEGSRGSHARDKDIKKSAYLKIVTN